MPRPFTRSLARLQNKVNEDVIVLLLHGIVIVLLLHCKMVLLGYNIFY
jgi:hypothetical protein